MSETQLSNQQHAELILLYETAVLEIAGFKQQQWAATYYVLVAQAAAVAIAQAISTNLQQIDRYVLVVLVALGLAFGVTVLRTLQISIECRRDRLRDARSHFGDPFNNARSKSKEPDPVPRILAAAQIVGALVAGWLVVARL